MSIQITLSKLIKSFGYAGQGFPVAFKGRNMRVHGIAALLVILTGLWFGITRFEWLVIFIFIAAVWSLEMINTAIEDLANTMRDTNHLGYEATKKARDVAAGAVLIMALIAAICAVIIFLPYIWLKPIEVYPGY